MMSARLVRIISSAYPTASAPDAHALTGVCTPARAPSSKPTFAAGPFGINIGTVCGLTSRAPLVFNVSYESRSVMTPPIPDAITTPSRSFAISGAPASFHASRDAMSANCSDRSSRRISTRSITSLGSTATGAPIATLSCDVISSDKVRTPLLPAMRCAHVVGTSPPSGVVAPSPVTTTRRRLMRSF